MKRILLCTSLDKDPELRVSTGLLRRLRAEGRSAWVYLPFDPIPTDFPPEDVITGEGEIRVSWTLPCEFGAFTPVVCGHEGRLSFATCSRRDPSLQVYVDVDPVSGGSDYYLSDINPSRFTVTDEGRLLGSSFRTKPLVSVCDLSEHVKREMELPEEVLSLIDGSSSPNETGSFLAFSTFPRSLCGDWCCWALCDDAGRPEHI